MEARKAREEAEERARRAQMEEAARRAAQVKEETLRRQAAFIKEYGVQQFLSLDALTVNPFVYQDKTVAVLANFEEMISEDTGLFAQESKIVVVSGLSREIRSRFTARYYVILAGRVLGKTEVRVPLLGSTAAPHLKFVGVHFCKDERCSDLIIGRE